MVDDDAAGISLLIPALLTDETDVRLLAATVAGVPQSLPARIVPVVQSAGPEAPALARAAQVALSEASPISQPIWLGEPCGKWGALRAALSLCPPSNWVAVADGDDAYELAALVETLDTGRIGTRRAGDVALLQGERGRIVLDETEPGRRRALLEPVVNELLRLRLAAAGVPLGPSVVDLQSGLLVVRRTLLADFFAQPRMDTFWLVAGLPGQRRGDRFEPRALPWSHYGGELHLHAFAAWRGLAVAAFPVQSRSGRISGQTPAGIGRQLRDSTLFAAVTAREVGAASERAAQRCAWSPAEARDARLAAAEAFADASA